jgi:hypothetical protein
MWHGIKIAVGIIIAIVIFYVIYEAMKSPEGFASREEKAEYLIEKAADSSSYSDFRAKSGGGFNTDFYKMQNLKRAGQLTRDTLASIL